MEKIDSKMYISYNKMGEFSIFPTKNMGFSGQLYMFTGYMVTSTPEDGRVEIVDSGCWTCESTTSSQGRHFGEHPLKR